MPFNWSENVTLKFLKEYKKHECLWNQNFSQYYNCCAKKLALRAIINKLNIPTLTETECQQQIEAITKKYEQEQSKTLHGLYSGKQYKSKIPWYPLMQDMLIKTLSNEKDNNLKVTICSNSVPDQKKKTQISKKKKTKSNVLSSATKVTTYDLCGHKIVRKPAPRPAPGKSKRLNKKSKKKKMTEDYTNYVQCPGFGTSNHSVNKLDERREVENSTSTTDQKNPPLESICVREIKKRRDIPRVNTLDTKTTECSSCCRQNLENNHYVAKDNYSPAKRMTPCTNYFNKQNNSNLNYNDFRYKDSNDQHRLQTRFVPCPNSLKSPDQFFSNCQNRNSYNYSKNIDNYSAPDRIVYSNNFVKNAELYCPRQVQELPEHDTNLNKPCCIRNVDTSMKSNKGLSLIPEVNDKNLCPTSDDRNVVQFIPRVATKFENGVFEAYSQFKISIQCCEKGLGKKVDQKATQETQTCLEKKQQSVCTNAMTYDTKETQHEGTETQSKQTGVDFEDKHIDKDKDKEIQNTVCVSSDQADEMKNALSDYILLMPGGKCVRLPQTICSKENFVPCQGVSESVFDDEAFSVCTETSCMTQESRFVDSDTMTTPQLIDCVEELLNLSRNSQEVQIEEIPVNPSRTEQRRIQEKESQCSACKNSEGVDEDLKFCFQKLFNKEISSSDCFPCLKEKIDKQATGELTKTFLCILKYALDLDCKAEKERAALSLISNILGSRFKSKSRTDMIRKICKCVKKLSEVEVIKRSKNKNLLTTNTQVEENRKYSKDVSTEQEPSISRSVNAISKNVGIAKQIGTENEPSISRSVNAISKNVGVSKEVETENEPSTSRSVNVISKNVGVSKQIGTENEPSISRSVNAIYKNVEVSKQTATESELSISRSANTIPKNVENVIQVKAKEIPLISRSMNTFVEETPMEIIKTHLENEETNTDFSNQQIEAGTNPIEKMISQDASTQVKARITEKHINKEKLTGPQRRDPILVRVVSANNRQRMKTQSQSSISGNEEFRRTSCKRVCFNEKTEYEIPKKDYKCGKECKELGNDWAKVRTDDKSNYKLKKKVLEKKLTLETPKNGSVANKKVFFSDFFL